MFVVYYDGKAISASENPHFAMSKATLEQAVNSADRFSFTLPANHPYRDLPEPRQGIVRIKNNGQTVFVGDVVEVKTSFDNSRTFECQGCLAWLNDVCNTKTTEQTTVSSTFTKRLEIYNSLCDSKRKIVRGNCENRPNAVVRIFTPDSFITIFEYFSTLISQKGGMMLPRYSGDTVVLDYVETSSRKSNQKIAFGTNLLNLDDFLSAAGTATAIYPTGKDGITIGSVSADGKDYVVNDALYSRYGMIAKPMQFEAETKAELLSQAKSVANLYAVLNHSLELTAFDLSVAHVDIDSISVGDNVEVISPPHGLNTEMLCTSKTTDFVDPAQSKITLGKSAKTMSGIVSMGDRPETSSELVHDFTQPVQFKDSVSTFGEVEVFGNTPHIDFHFGNSNADYTSRIIENATGAIDILAPNGIKLNGSNLKYDDTAIKNRLTAIEKKENVTLTANADRISNVSYTAKYSELLGAVFVRIYGKISADLNAGYDYDLFTIGSKVPDSNAALSVKCAKNAMALAKTSDKGSAIQICPLESGINGYDVYITGFWFV